MTKLRFAVIGCGRMGERRARIISQNANSEVLCVVDSNRARAKSLSEELDCGYHTDYNAVIGRDDVDVILVSVPNKFHSEISIQSMKLGKHVFCEKPLAITVEEAKLMVEASIDNGVSLSVSSNARFFANVEKAKKLVDEKAIGELLFARGWIGHGGWNLTPSSWFTDPELIGGGTMLDNGCHIIDLTRWFMGEIKDCFGYCVTLLHKKLPSKLEDNSVGILIGLDGKPTMIQSSWTEWNGYFYMEIYGELGILYLDNRGDNAIATIKTENSVVKTFDYSKEPKNSFKKETDYFISCMLDEKQFSPNGYDGMKTIQVIQGLYKSSREGRKISCL